MGDVDQRIRNANDYAFSQGFVGAFPNFHEADYGAGLVYGTVLVHRSAAVGVDILRAQLGGATQDNVPELFRRVNDYAVKNGFAGGFPTCHAATYAQGVVQGGLLFRHDAVEWRDVRNADLGSPRLDDVGAMMRAAHNYAVRTGFAAGVPTFHQADYGRGPVNGITLIKPGFVVARVVWADIYTMFQRFTFVPGITRDRVFRLFARHVAAYEHIRECPRLSLGERAALLAAYRRRIEHRIETNPRANASAAVGGSWVAVNFDVLFPLGDDEISQTLIHEMMHCAGYNHPVRRDYNPANPGAPVDRPGDNGPYYGSPPLRAEFCIAGQQSDLSPAFAPAAVAMATGAVFLSTVKVRSEGDPSEYVSVTNGSGDTVDLGGWELRRGPATFKFPAVHLDGGETVIIDLGGGVDGGPVPVHRWEVADSALEPDAFFQLVDPAGGVVHEVATSMTCEVGAD